MEKKQYIDVELVKALMKARGIDEKTMATLLGVTPPTVKKFLSGADQKHMLGDMVYKVSSALNVNPELIIYKDYH